ncbi:MAG: hypothetical protein SVK08_01215 [Halobacteriota archaeon]|nr:hypothetical protein [Halobacteriota archaeon]
MNEMPSLDILDDEIKRDGAIPLNEMPNFIQKLIKAGECEGVVWSVTWLNLIGDRSNKIEMRWIGRRETDEK